VAAADCRFRRPTVRAGRDRGVPHLLTSPADRRWYDRSALEVAPDLLGAVVIHDSADGRVAVRVVETEAYLGPEDLAAHSARGQTARNEPMWGPPGHAYVYRVYGIHDCLNVVCGPGRKPEAVLLRAGEVVEGVTLAQARRGERVPIRRLASGPGNLGRALGVDRNLSGSDLLGGPISIRVGQLPALIDTRSRIGVDYAGAWAARPYRFVIADDPHVSRA
jgi:DNA-3-methyladenine glycosylase